MRKFKVIYGIGNGESEEIVECKSFSEAYKLGEEMAFDELDSMGGLHGYPYEEDYDSCDDIGKRVVESQARRYLNCALLEEDDEQ